jgi:uncharacterized protein YndB with AHSA1/START domain
MTGRDQKFKMTTAEKTSLEIKRVMRAPRDRVYAAWTNAAELKQWFGPEGVGTREIIADARVGGLFRWDLIDQEGDDVSIRGQFLEVEKNRRIVFTWQFEGDAKWKDCVSIVTVEFDDAGEGETELRLRHEQLPDKDSRDAHNEGWKSVFDKLEKFLG